MTIPELRRYLAHRVARILEVRQSATQSRRDEKFFCRAELHAVEISVDAYRGESGRGSKLEHARVAMGALEHLGDRSREAERDLREHRCEESHHLLRRRVGPHARYGLLKPFARIAEAMENDVVESPPGELRDRAEGRGCEHHVPNEWKRREPLKNPGDGIYVHDSVGGRVGDDDGNRFAADDLLEVFPGGRNEKVRLFGEYVPDVRKQLRRQEYRDAQLEVPGMSGTMCMLI